jgi:hypothetical protein
MAYQLNIAHRLIVLLILASSASGVCLPQVCAQDSDGDAPSLIRVPKLGTNPLAVVTLANVQQARQKFELLCEIAGHPETAEILLASLDESTDSLSGVDQERPGGLAVYLDSIFPPSFEFVAFVPVSNSDSFMRTLELGPVIASPVADEEGRYELLGPTQTSQVRVQNGYTFIQLPIMDPDSEFDRKLFEPLSLLKGQNGQYDISVTLDVESVPRATRNLVLSFLTSTMSTQMQQRDEEADGLYEMRRAWMQADIDTYKLFLDECQRITVGLSVDTEQHLANLDFLIDVREGSDLLNEIFESATKPSYFAPVLNDDAAVSLSMSQVMAERDQVRYVGVLDGFKKELARQVAEKELGSELDDISPVFAALTSLQETLRDGHLDVFGQCYKDSNGDLVVVAALRVLQGETIASGLTDILNRLQGQDGLENLQIGYGEHAGVQFHRIGFADTDVGRMTILGADPGLIVGSGPRSMWFGIGGDETLDTLGGVMDSLLAAYEQPTQPAHSSNTRIVVNVNQIIELVQTESSASRAKAVESDDAENDLAEESTKESSPANPSTTRRQARRRRFREQRKARQNSWVETLAEGGDRIRMDFQPTKRGARWRMEFGEAFLKGIGRAVAVSVTPQVSDEE